MEFQVNDFTKPLAAVWRISEKGNRVCFWPGGNINSGEKLPLERKGEHYVIQVDFIKQVFYRRGGIILQGRQRIR